MSQLPVGSLEANARVIGFGAGTVYAMVRDITGKVALVKYKL